LEIERGRRTLGEKLDEDLVEDLDEWMFEMLIHFVSMIGIHY